VLRLKFDSGDRALRRILCFGAHCDDIEIGCGGTILRLIEEHPDLEVQWVVFGSDGPRREEGEASAKLFLKGTQNKRVVFHDFRDGFFPYNGKEIKERFLALERETAPDLIFTHYRHDLHQDHRLISELTWNSFRDHLILEYEIPKYDGDLGQPNLFVPLDSDVCEKKLDFIMDTFRSQQTKLWFRRDTFLALMRLRGVECNAASGYAEAFYCHKLVL
jgi:LmbE family N-acetylglucosaminyl deacetylase